LLRCTSHHAPPASANISSRANARPNHRRRVAYAESYGAEEGLCMKEDMKYQRAIEKLHAASIASDGSVRLQPLCAWLAIFR